MLPPVDPRVLAANPQFEALYRDLCGNRLNGDGTAKLEAGAQRERDTLQDDLRRARIQAAKSEILRHSLYEVAYQSDDLPDDLRELVGVMLALLLGHVPSNDADLIHDDMERFTRHATPITRALSKILQHNATLIASSVDPDNPPRTDRIPIRLRELIAASDNTRAQIHQSRLGLAEDAVAVQSLSRQILENSIRLLEQTINGSVSRGVKARADYLSLVAEGISKKLSVLHQQLTTQLYSDEMNGVLQRHHAELQREARVVERKITEAEGKLIEYQSDRSMAVMAREYADVMVEMERVQEEVKRLEAAA